MGRAEARAATSSPHPLPLTYRNTVLSNISSLFLLARAASHYTCSGLGPLKYTGTPAIRNTEETKKINKFFMVYLVDHANIEF